MPLLETLRNTIQYSHRLRESVIKYTTLGLLHILDWYGDVSKHVLKAELSDKVVQDPKPSDQNLGQAIVQLPGLQPERVLSVVREWNFSQNMTTPHALWLDDLPL